MPPKIRSYPKKCLAGKRFNMLRVKSFVGYLEDSKKRRHAIWECQCDCGNFINIRQSQLKRGQKSCGCILRHFRKYELPKIAKKRNSKPKGVAAKNALYYSYKQRSKLKNIEFKINFNLFIEMTGKNCYYCNSKPSSSLFKNGKKKCNGDYIYNGLDRINNNKGYIKNNVVTCCEICNKAKRDLSQEEFLKWVMKITKNLPNLYQLVNQPEN